MAKNTQQPELSMVDQVRIRREKLAQLQQEGQNPFAQTKFEFTSNSAEIKKNFEQVEGKEVSVSGRLMTKRGMGKVMFCDLQDAAGRIQIYLKIDDDKISDVKFETFGCGSAIASSSMATELIKGKPLSQALELTNKAVAEALDGLPAYKMHCSVLAEEAIKAAVKDYYDKHGIAYDESKFSDCSHCDHCEA